MKPVTQIVNRDDLMSIAMAVLMFALQACMVFAISTNTPGDVRPAARAGQVADHLGAVLPRGRV